MRSIFLAAYPWLQIIVESLFFKIQNGQYIIQKLQYRLENYVRD